MQDAFAVVAVDDAAGEVIVQVGKDEFIRLVLAQQIEDHGWLARRLHDVGQLARLGEADLHEFKGCRLAALDGAAGA